MSLLARSAPENEAMQSLSGQREALTDLVDREDDLLPNCPECERLELTQLFRHPTKNEPCSRHRENP